MTTANRKWYNEFYSNLSLGQLKMIYNETVNRNDKSAAMNWDCGYDKEEVAQMFRDNTEEIMIIRKNILRAVKS